MDKTIKDLNNSSKNPTQIVNRAPSRLLDVSKPTIEVSQLSFKVK